MKPSAILVSYLSYPASISSDLLYVASMGLYISHPIEYGLVDPKVIFKD
jgi:hypothetical protein